MHNYITKLIKQPIYHFSLSSKELFHSNFIAWLAELDPHACLGLFGHHVTGSITIRRELKRGNAIADIVFLLDSKVYLIIENKVKDIPHQDQLDRITQSFGSNPKYIILSLYNGYNGSYNGWNKLSYKNLAQKLKLNVDSFAKGDSYYKYIINDYIELL